MMVTRLAWMAHKLVSSKRPTRYASDASWSASTAVDWKRKSVLKSCAISRTRRWNGSLRIKSSVDFWYLLRADRGVMNVPEVSQRALLSLNRILNRAPSLFTQTTRTRVTLRRHTYRISRSATVPGRYLCGFLTPPVAGADLRAALVASCFLGALPPVDLRAVCLVRAIVFDFQ